MRIQAIKFFYFSVVILIIFRLAFWQIVKADELQALAEGQRFTSKEVFGQRGKILFSDGSTLASNQPSYLVFYQPQLLRQKKFSEGDIREYIKLYAKKIADIFWGLDNQGVEVLEEDKKKQIEELTEELVKKMNQNLSWVNLGKKVTTETKKRLEDLNIIGLGFDQQSMRLYPEGSSSAHLLGFVASDLYGSDKGYFGVEGYYDGELRGKKGILTEERDAMGLPILIGKFLSKKPRDGKTLKLNIDRSVQHIVEDKLKKGLEKYKASGVSALIMEPKTGNILAMASLPSYDPADTLKYPKENFKNPITVDGYEPGSTFKVLVMAAALNEKVVEPDTVCDNCKGPVEISNYTIKTWNNKYQEKLTMTDAIIHSDNTGMVFAGKKLGLDKLYSYIENFGFGDLTSVDLQDESTPILRPKKEWREIDLATATFGQGISVSALQVVRAVSSIANGGKLMEPHVVSSIAEGNEINRINPRVISQPISEEAAKLVTEMMIKAVEEGESKHFKPKGYKIAGKTGTAQIPLAGHYDPNKTIASFVGFAPAEDPKFVMLVRYDKPTTSIYGADTAAPTFFEIAKELFTYYGVPPTELHELPAPSDK